MRAIYLLTENDEAYDNTWYCSEACRTEGRANLTQAGLATLDGENNEYIDGTVCDTCGLTLDKQEAK